MRRPLPVPQARRGGLSPTTVPGTPNARPTPPGNLNRGIETEDIARFAKYKGITFGDAESAFSDAKAIVDFKRAFGDDSEFGNVWVQYDGTYSVHLRTITRNSVLKASLKVKGLRIDHYGGKSARQTKINLAKATLLAMKYSGSVAVDLQGDVVLTTRQKPTTAETTGLIVVDEEPLTLLPGESYAGAPTDSANTGGKCTVGFPIKRDSDNWAGIVTAGHCGNDYWTPNGSWGRWVDSLNKTTASNTENIDYNWATTGAWPSEWDSCAPDRQVNPVSLQDSYAIFFNRSTDAWTSVYDQAIGWYDGQPIYRTGRRTEQVGNLLYPTIAQPNRTAWGTNIVPSDAECGSRSLDGFRYEPKTSLGGDSGGPLLFAYDGLWFAGGIHITGSAAGDFGFAEDIGDAIPPGWRLCSAVSC